MNKTDIENFEKELFERIKDYNLKDFRKGTATVHNIRWLHKNIRRFNSDKEDIDRVYYILTILSKEKK